MAINDRLNLKVIQFLALTFITLLIFFQTAAWGTIGIAEWEISTPGGNKIGNNDNLPNDVHTAIYSTSSNVYIKTVQEYGFYDGMIIGKAEQGFFIFNEKSKQVNYFPTKEQLCSEVKQKGLKLVLSYSLYQYCYYLIRYSLYFLIAFISLFIIYQRPKKQNFFDTQVDSLLKSKWFALQLYLASGSINFLLLVIISTGPNVDLLSLLFVLPLSFIVLGFIFFILWLFAQLSLRLVSQVADFAININALKGDFVRSSTTLLKLILFIGIFVAGLFLTFSAWEAPLKSFRYFSCNLS